MVLLIALVYFGALVIPIIYVLAGRGGGPATRRMLVGAASQIFLSLAVYAFVHFSWRQGYNEFYWGFILLIPTNILAFIYYLIVLLVDTRKANQ
jgi:hypothetical protein